jgi:hypothetical protein
MSNRPGGFIAGQNINVSIGTFTAVTSPTFTFASTQATPVVGQAVQFTTTGTLPTGLSTNTTYYVISTSTNTCQFSTAQSGSAVTFTNSSGSGTHTAVTQRAFNPYGGAPNTVEYLVVAGGGSGGGYFGGGGGAGGLLTAAGFSVATGSALTITVGAGGAAVLNQNTGNAGSNSVFSSITATGGGYGAGYPSSPGGAGGSGGGACIYAQIGGTGVSGQGNNGGSTLVDDAFRLGGGGGGAGSAGRNGDRGGGLGNGGTGLCSTITGSRVFYAGGGGGSSTVDYYSTLGGGGGGGNSFYTASTKIFSSGVANTGGGGAGQPEQAGGFYSGAGGSGIVIIRYPQINSAPALVTGSPQLNYADGYQIYTFTSSGSIIF